MYKICKTPKSEARQIEFQETLLKMLKKQKLKDITIVSLCQEVGISRKTFYQYFDTIEDVLYVILDTEIRNGFLRLELNPEIGDFFSFWQERKWLLDILAKNGMSQMLVDRAYSTANFGKEEEMYTIRNMKNAGWISAIITVLVLWHHGGMRQTPEEMQELVYTMFHVNKDILTKNREK
ncbi:MAG: HTH domain-containing protein [Anaerotignum sp.]|nr:HTH domain-containing protein [Anaerotignum sp.]